MRHSAPKQTDSNKNNEPSNFAGIHMLANNKKKRNYLKDYQLKQEKEKEDCLHETTLYQVYGVDQMFQIVAQLDFPQIDITIETPNLQEEMAQKKDKSWSYADLHMQIAEEFQESLKDVSTLIEVAAKLDLIDGKCAGKLGEEKETKKIGFLPKSLPKIEQGQTNLAKGDKPEAYVQHVHLQLDIVYYQTENDIPDNHYEEQDGMLFVVAMTQQKAHLSEDDVGKADNHRDTIRGQHLNIGTLYIHVKEFKQGINLLGDLAEGLRAFTLKMQLEEPGPDQQENESGSDSYEKIVDYVKTQCHYTVDSNVTENTSELKKIIVPVPLILAVKMLNQSTELMKRTPHIVHPENFANNLNRRAKKFEELYQYFQKKQVELEKDPETTQARKDEFAKNEKLESENYNKALRIIKQI